MSNLLKNALKALFTKSSTIASTDKIPFNDSEGNVKGQVSISDLQQVLGVTFRAKGRYPHGVTRSVDDIENGYYTIEDPSIQGITFTVYPGFLISFTPATGFSVQLYIAGLSIYARGRWSGGTWAQWKEFQGDVIE